MTPDRPQWFRSEFVYFYGLSISDFEQVNARSDFINPFHATDLLFYPLKVLENH